MRVLPVAFVAAGMLASCSGKKAEPQRQPIAKVACDESFESIMEQEIAVFEYVYPKEDVIAYYLPESEAIDSIMAMGSVKNAVATRALTEQEVAYLKSHKKIVHQQRIAVDAIALIVNPENPVEILSKKEIAEILTGDVTRWDQVVPSKLGEIKVIFDHQGSSTVQYMRDSLLNGGQFGPNVFAQQTPEDVFKAVRDNKNAVGIIGVSWISSDLKTREMNREEFAASVQSNDSVSNSADMRFSEDVKVIKVRGNDEVTAYMPYQLYIFDGSYPLYRQIYMICTATGGTISHGFYSFVTGFHGQKIMMTTGVLPKVVQPTLVNIN